MFQRRIKVLISVLALLTLMAPTASAQDNPKSTTKLQTKIVGGTTVPISYAPWQVALLDLSISGRGDWQKQFCGGSIISRTWILTAAHCLYDGVSLRNLRVLSGQAALNTRRLSNNLSTVKTIEIHDLYNPVTLENDLALIQLTNPLVLQPEFVEIIQIPSIKPLQASVGRISGWGYAWPNDGYLPGIPVPGQIAYPSNLMGGEVSILSDFTCLTSLGDEYNQTAMLCAQGGVNDQGIVVDTCYGDSGGPLAVNSAGIWMLSGITSWGIGCGWETPGVYTNVASYKSWIDARINLKSPQVITFSPPTSLTLAQSPFTLTASSSSGLTPEISSSTPLVCTVTTLTVTLISTGTCNLAANQNGNDYFEPAPVVNRSILVILSLTPQSINFSPPSSLSLSQSPFTLVATATSGLAPVITVQTTRTCTLDGNVLTLRSVGTCRLTATQSGNEEYAPATPVTVQINIRRR